MFLEGRRAAARFLLSWSSGKNRAWTPYVLRQQDLEVVALVTAFNESANRVAMHAARRELAEARACAATLPVESLPFLI